MKYKSTKVLFPLKRFRVNRKYKDRLFVRLFSKREHLLELYNALNGSNYTDISQLIVTTLEDAVYLGMKNDVSFLIGNRLNLFEHQSSFCPNMPVRGLLYIAELYHGYIAMNQLNMYGSKLITLPAPQYVVFYNGTEEYPDVSELHLSDAFAGEISCLEFTAKMYNINHGHNNALMEHCKVLKEYSAFISTIRRFQDQGYKLRHAVELATEECIENNILKEFLLKNRGEVRKMLLVEYSPRKQRELDRRDAREEGLEEGRKEGRKEGIRALINTCKALGASQTITKQRLEEEFELSKVEAVEAITQYW